MRVTEHRIKAHGLPDLLLYDSLIDDGVLLQQDGSLRERQACPCGEVRRIGEERLTELEKQIAELITFRNQLARAVSQWRKSPEVATSSLSAAWRRSWWMP